MIQAPYAPRGFDSANTSVTKNVPVGVGVAGAPTATGTASPTRRAHPGERRRRHVDVYRVRNRLERDVAAADPHRATRSVAAPRPPCRR
jgi:hypothetical protein